VWIPKYRHPVLRGEIRTGLLGFFDSIAESLGVEILASEVMDDHIHLFVSAPPRFSPADLVNTFKGVTARMLRMKFPELKKHCKEGLWTRTYYAGTAGAITEDTIRRYVELQTSQAQHADTESL
jgi:putative transposase